MRELYIYAENTLILLCIYVFLSVTILLNNSNNGEFKNCADFNVDSLNDIIHLLRSRKTFFVERDHVLVQDET